MKYINKSKTNKFDSLNFKKLVLVNKNIFKSQLKIYKSFINLLIFIKICFNSFNFSNEILTKI